MQISPTLFIISSYKLKTGIFWVKLRYEYGDFKIKHPERPQPEYHPLYSMESDWATEIIFMHLSVVILIHTYPVRSKCHAIWGIYSKSNVKVTKKVIKCKKLSCQFFNSMHSPEDPGSIWPPVTEIKAQNLVHRVFYFTVVNRHEAALKTFDIWRRCFMVHIGNNNIKSSVITNSYCF